MTSAIVLSPGTAKKKGDRLYVVVKIPTIECAVSHVPKKLPNLNVFQRGVAYFLLAGLRHADEISRVMGITDSDFVDLLLSELAGHGYAKEIGEREFIPTSILRKDFLKTVDVAESHSRQLCAFLPAASGKGTVKVAGPFLRAQPSEIDQSISPAKVAVGTVGQPLQVDCIVSEWESPVPAKVDRDTAKKWICGLPDKNAKDSNNGSSTRVEVLNTRSMAFVLQCQLTAQNALSASSAGNDQLLGALTVRFAGEKKPNQNLARWLTQIAGSDPEFAEEFLDSLRGLSDAPDSALGPDQIVDERDLEDNENTVTRQNTKKKPLTWLVELLNSRLHHLGTTSLEAHMADSKSMARQVADRLGELGSNNRNSPVPPLQTLQLEVILAGEFHNELDISAVLGVWLLLERGVVLEQLIQLNPKFIEGVCDIFVNIHVEVSKDVRETFEYLGSIK